jgi:hypothetical protein
VPKFSFVRSKAGQGSRGGYRFAKTPGCRPFTFQRLTTFHYIQL